MERSLYVQLKDWMSNSVDPDKTARYRLIWIYAVCKSLQLSPLAVQKFLDTGFKKTITKTRLFKYIENFTSKNWKFSDKKFWYFSSFCTKHRFGYSLEPPRRGGTHNLCFYAEK